MPQILNARQCFLPREAPLVEMHPVTNGRSVEGHVLRSDINQPRGAAGGNAPGFKLLVCDETTTQQRGGLLETLAPRLGFARGNQQQRASERVIAPKNDYFALRHELVRGGHRDIQRLKQLRIPLPHNRERHMFL